MRVLHEATRELLYCSDAGDVASVIEAAVRALGGDIVTITDHNRNMVLPLGDDRIGAAAATALRPRTAVTLARYLPALLADARAVERLTGLAHQAEVDALTGLDNHRAARKLLPRLRSGDVVAVIDLDRFKDVNDLHGHPSGDAVLAAFGRLLLDEARPVDRYFRSGGDEFLAVYHQQSLAEVLAVLGRLRAVWAQRSPWSSTFSAGVAVVDDGGGAAAAGAADERMYEAKDAGRDQIIGP